MTNEQLRRGTGTVGDGRPLVAFLYDLLTTHLPAGTVEQLVQDSESSDPGHPCVFTNGYTARYAQLLAERLGVREA